MVAYLDYTEWQSVYTTLFTYRFNATATLAAPAVVFTQVASVATQNAGSIAFAGLHYRYERFKSNAVSSNLVYVSNNKIYDRAGRPTPKSSIQFPASSPTSSQSSTNPALPSHPPQQHNHHGEYPSPTRYPWSGVYSGSGDLKFHTGFEGWLPEDGIAN
jgi:hypothetical protein